MSLQPTAALQPAHLSLIEALARAVVADYLRPEAPAGKAAASSSTKPVPLPQLNRAA